MSITPKYVSHKTKYGETDGDKVVYSKDYKANTQDLSVGGNKIALRSATHHFRSLHHCLRRDFLSLLR